MGIPGIQESGGNRAGRAAPSRKIWEWWQLHPCRNSQDFPGILGSPGAHPIGITHPEGLQNSQRNPRRREKLSPGAGTEFLPGAKAANGAAGNIWEEFGKECGNVDPQPPPVPEFQVQNLG